MRSRRTVILGWVLCRTKSGTKVFFYLSSAI